MTRDDLLRKYSGLSRVSRRWQEGAVCGEVEEQIIEHTGSRRTSQHRALDLLVEKVHVAALVGGGSNRKDPGPFPKPQLGPYLSDRRIANNNAYVVLASFHIKQQELCLCTCRATR